MYHHAQEIKLFQQSVAHRLGSHIVQVGGAADARCPNVGFGELPQSR